MNKYQKQIHKQIKNIIDKEARLLDDKYPIIHKNYRNVRHLLERLELEGKRHYRKVKKELKNK